MIDYIKLQKLSDKVKNNTASSEEKDEYMLMLYRNGSITKSQYEKYKTDKSNTETLNAAVTIGGIILLGYLIGKLIHSNERN